MRMRRTKKRETKRRKTLNDFRFEMGGRMANFQCEVLIFLKMSKRKVLVRRGNRGKRRMARNLIIIISQYDTLMYVQEYKQS